MGLWSCGGCAPLWLQDAGAASRFRSDAPRLLVEEAGGHAPHDMRYAPPITHIPRTPLSLSQCLSKLPAAVPLMGLLAKAFNSVPRPARQVMAS